VTRDLPRYVHRYKSRHGQERVYFHRGNGHPYVRITEELGSAAFHRVYAELLDREKPSKIVKKVESIAPVAAETFRWLCVRYAQSVEFKQRDRSILDACCQELLGPKDKRVFADMPLSDLSLQAVKVLRDRKVKAGLPEAGNNRVKSLKRLFKWATAEGLLPANPAAQLEKVKNNSKGWIPWTAADLEAYENRHPIGTKARLAFDILQYLGCARVDVVELGNANVHVVNRTKVARYNRGKTDVEANVPIPQRLLDSIAATKQVGIKTWLVTEYGKPFSPAGFGNRFAEWCRQAGVSVRAHGLRKTAASREAEKGATAFQLCAAFGWMTLKEAERYCQSASRRKLGAMMGSLGSSER
jgi:site-specific recombinase XerD